MKFQTIKTTINGTDITFKVKTHKIKIEEIYKYEKLEANRFFNLISDTLNHYNTLNVNQENDLYEGDIYDSLMSPLKYSNIIEKLTELDNDTLIKYLRDRKDIEKEIIYIKSYILISRSNKKLTYKEFRSSSLPLPLLVEISKIYDSI